MQEVETSIFHQVSVCRTNALGEKQFFFVINRENRFFSRLHDKKRNSIAALFACWSKGSMLGHRLVLVSTPKSVVWVLVLSLQCFPQALIAG